MTSKVGKTERYSGRDEDRDVFLLRFECDAQEYNHWRICKDTMRRPQTTTEIAAISDATAKAAAQKYSDKYVQATNECYTANVTPYCDTIIIG